MFESVRQAALGCGTKILEKIREDCMAKIRHLAIRTEDPGKLAKFYIDVFGLEVLHRDKREGGNVVLTDGYFNLAILPNPDQRAPIGLYHFGFEVESTEAIIENMKKINHTKLPKPRPDGTVFAETRAADPDGNYFDLSEHGYLDLQPVGEKKKD